MLGQRFWRRCTLMWVLMWVFTLALSMLLALPQVHAQTQPQAAPSLQVLFTPWDNAEQALLKEIGRAQKQILVQAFVFTSRTLAQALIQAQQRGVQVQILADRER